MQPNTIKAELRRGATLVGMWIKTGSPDLAEAAVRYGWPVIFIDNEHGVADLSAAVDVHRAVLSAGGDVILRVPSADPVYLKLALDRGFRSIMAPMINSVDEARAFAEACRYPPLGGRGFAPSTARCSGFGADADYLSRSADELLLIAQIEHVDAVDAIEDIAAVSGIDCLFLGPSDLAGSMGLLGDASDPKIVEMCEKVERKVVASKAIFGTICRPGRSARDLHDLGCRLIAGPADISIFTEGARAAHAAFSIEPKSKRDAGEKSKTPRIRRARK